MKQLIVGVTLLLVIRGWAQSADTLPVSEAERIVRLILQTGGDVTFGTLPEDYTNDYLPLPKNATYILRVSYEGRGTNYYLELPNPAKNSQPMIEYVKSLQQAGWVLQNRSGYGTEGDSGFLCRYGDGAVTGSLEFQRYLDTDAQIFQAVEAKGEDYRTFVYLRLSANLGVLQACSFLRPKVFAEDEVVFGAFPPEFPTAYFPLPTKASIALVMSASGDVGEKVYIYVQNQSNFDLPLYGDVNEYMHLLLSVGWELYERPNMEMGKDRGVLCLQVDNRVWSLGFQQYLESDTKLPREVLEQHLGKDTDTWLSLELNSTTMLLQCQDYMNSR